MSRKTINMFKLTPDTGKKHFTVHKAKEGEARIAYQRLLPQAEPEEFYVTDQELPVVYRKEAENDKFILLRHVPYGGYLVVCKATMACCLRLEFPETTYGEVVLDGNGKVTVLIKDADKGCTIQTDGVETLADASRCVVSLKAAPCCVVSLKAAHPFGLAKVRDSIHVTEALGGKETATVYFMMS